MLKQKDRLLLILHFSPPVHGASKVGDIILSSNVLRRNFFLKHIKIKSSNSLEAIGKFDFIKIFDTILLYFKVIAELIKFKPKKIYFTVSPKGFAFYRDLSISIFVKIYCAFTHCDVFYHYHAKGVNEFTSQSILNRRLTNFFIKNVNIIFISKLMLGEVNNLTGYKSCLVLKNGVEDGIEDINFNDLLERRKENKKINVLYLSNMIKEKGYDTVLQLAKKIKEENINITINFAGSWASLDNEKHFFSYVKDNKLQGIVNYHGLVIGEKKKSLFKQANLFIFPSRYPKEVFPLSILEALSYGLPVLAFDIGAISEIIDAEIGIITQKDSIFESFNKLKNEYLKKEVSLACRKRFLENYTTEVFEKNLVNIIKS